MMLRQLFLPLHQAHALISGQATRILVRKQRGDVIALHDDGWLITDEDGYVRFAAEDRIVIAGPEIGHVCTVKLLSLSDTPKPLREISRQYSRDFGYDDLSELWQDFAFRYDHAAHRHWMFCKRKLEKRDYTEVFRSFISSRDPHVWTAWMLYVVLESVHVNAQKGQAS